jgi:hypothetical protein
MPTFDLSTLTKMKTTAKLTTVTKAIKSVNKRYGYKIEFKTCEQRGKWVHFTIKSKSGIPGARESHSGRNLPSASWYAHGFLFDQIFKMEPSAIIWSAKRRITKQSGNWEDFNIGSVMQPCYFSDVSILSGREWKGIDY